MTDTDDARAAPVRGRQGQLASAWQLLSLARPPQRRSLGLGIAFGVMASLADIASLAMLKPAIGAVGLDSADSARFSLALFIIAAIVASGFRLAAIRQTVSTQYGMANSLAVASFERLQKQDYSAFLKDGASPGFAAFDRLYMLSFQVLAPTIGALTAACSIVVLLTGLAVIEPWAALFFAVLVVAVVIKLESPGPVIFRQMRVGQGNRRRFRPSRIFKDEETVVADFGDQAHGLVKVIIGLAGESDDDIPRDGVILAGPFDHFDLF